jgi:hypothetical protein
VWHPVRRDTRSAHSRQLLRAAEAECEIVGEWLSLPENERQTEHQAAQFALEMKRKYVFDYVGGDRYQEIRRMILRHARRPAA